MLPGTELDVAHGVAERVRIFAEAQAVQHERSPHEVVTLSIGVAALVPSSAADAARLLHAADDALYEAKRGGRNRAVAGQIRSRLAARRAIHPRCGGFPHGATRVAQHLVGVFLLLFQFVGGVADLAPFHARAEDRVLAAIEVLAVADLLPIPADRRLAGRRVPRGRQGAMSRPGSPLTRAGAEVPDDPPWRSRKARRRPAGRRPPDALDAHPAVRSVHLAETAPRPGLKTRGRAPARSKVPQGGAISPQLQGRQFRFARPLLGFEFACASSPHRNSPRPRGRKC